MTTKTCRKCDGTGYLPQVAHVDGGRCWSCNQADNSYAIDGTPANIRAQARFHAEHDALEAGNSLRRRQGSAQGWQERLASLIAADAPAAEIAAATDRLTAALEILAAAEARAADTAAARDAVFALYPTQAGD